MEECDYSQFVISALVGFFLKRVLLASLSALFTVFPRLGSHRHTVSAV
jgi:hypothetical protein